MNYRKIDFVIPFEVGIIRRREGLIFCSPEIYS